MEKTKFNRDSFLFTVDWESLYTNAHFVIELLEIVLKNSLMTFDKEYFQQIFEIKMGTNLAPILANLYMAMLQEDGFGIMEGTKKDVEYWILQFNNLRKSINIDKWSFGNHVEYMDLYIYTKEKNFILPEFWIFVFYKKKSTGICIFLKKSGHVSHTIKNYEAN